MKMFVVIQFFTAEYDDIFGPFDTREEAQQWIDRRPKEQYVSYSIEEVKR